MAQKYTAEVIRKDQITDHVYFVTFKLLEPSSITFRAGQCMMLMCAQGVNRTMSIASVPTETTQVSMIADVSPMGPGSKWTLGLNVGDNVHFVAPTGVFLFDDVSPRKKIFVATGTGVAPFHSMILDNPMTSMTLYWGLRYESDIYWKEEFDTIASLNPFFMWHLILSKPTQVWKGLVGHVTEHVLQSDTDLTKNDYYLCGNKEMIGDVREKLLARNVPKDQIKSELFY